MHLERNVQRTYHSNHLLPSDAGRKAAIIDVPRLCKLACRCKKSKIYSNNLFRPPLSNFLCGERPKGWNGGLDLEHAVISCHIDFSQVIHIASAIIKLN
jgi:hypothetical protein